jgi:hypothetical protein
MDTNGSSTVSFEWTQMDLTWKCFPKLTSASCSICDLWPTFRVIKHMAHLPKPSIPFSPVSRRYDESTGYRFFTQPISRDLLKLRSIHTGPCEPEFIELRAGGGSSVDRLVRNFCHWRWSTSFWGKPFEILTSGGRTMHPGRLCQDVVTLIQISLSEIPDF